MSSQSNRQLTSLLSVLLLIVGCFCIGYTMMWPDGDGGRSVWGPEKAVAKRRAAVEAHQSMTAFQTDPVLANRKAFRKKQAEYNQLEQDRLAAIQGARQFVQRVRWVGIGLVGMGVVLYAFGKKRAGRDITKTCPGLRTSQ